MKLFNVLNQGIRNNIDLYSKFTNKYNELLEKDTEDDEQMSKALMDFIVEINKLIHNLVVGSTEDLTNKYLQLDYIKKLDLTKQELIEKIKKSKYSNVTLAQLEDLTNSTLSLLEHYREGYFDMVSGMLKQAIKNGTEFNRLWIN